jgi:hypothetical protein
METKKHTAVEWLVNELNQKIDFIPMDKWDIIRGIVQQSLAMEKEQIVDAYLQKRGKRSITGVLNCMDEAYQYYNETYEQ